MIAALVDVVDEWHPASLPGTRGRTGVELAVLLHSAGIRAVVAHDTVVDACTALVRCADRGDRIVVLGSFHTVAPVLAAQPWLIAYPAPH